MAKALGLQKVEGKAMEELFETLSHSSAKISLLTTTLQKYQNMTSELSDFGTEDSESDSQEEFEPKSDSQDAPVSKEIPKEISREICI